MILRKSWSVSVNHRVVQDYTHKIKKSRAISQDTVNVNVSKTVSVKELRSSGLLCNEWWSLLTNVSGQPIGPIFNGQESRKGPIFWSETSARNYHYSLRNSPEERSSYLLRGVSLKSRTISTSCVTQFDEQLAVPGGIPQLY
jgi:hypothetical protein